ncbi:TPA: nucleotidyltransferase [Serratia marcescens]|nr:nucleotidyltransferase [Serratia marcescens]MBH2692691.1 nucleotidyltransferase [Serratia marcescens]MBH2737022.1 nucleotidyltransferase [Serratia marcescens]MBH2831053.1 nucleotidyltransferase [Serratia marcescens]MBH3224441.1 nucleotidyltransferase [Serratia marcescens]
MSIADIFQRFLRNLAVDNAQTISDRYGEITCVLNKKFRDTESKTANTLQVGSYGRYTAIKGISDLDMLYIMPKSEWDNYKDGGQSRLLSDSANAIRARYPNTIVKVDRLVVQVIYSNFRVEAQPVFEQDDGSFKYPDTYNGGAWKITKPREEIRAMSEFDTQKNRNLRRLCKMVRAWKNKHGVGVGGLLIDTLAHNFLKSNSDYDDKSYFYYDYMSRDFFAYLSELPKQDYYAALGSGQRVKVKKNFQRKAKKAHELCLKAIEAEGKDNQSDRWRAVYGRPFPAGEEVHKAELAERVGHLVHTTEEYAEDVFGAIDIRNNIRIDCQVEQNGFRPASLRDMLNNRALLMPRKKLTFSVAETDITGPYSLFWKVLNRGQEAFKRDCIRGQIVADEGYKSNVERTNFKGDHVVECYAVVDGVVVATDRIHVPISTNQEDLNE